MSTVTFSTPANPRSDGTVAAVECQRVRQGVLVVPHRCGVGRVAIAGHVGYLVFRDGVQVSRLDLPAGLRFSDNGLAASSSHKYSIKAIDAAGNISSPTAGRAGNTLGTGEVLIRAAPTSPG